jgi:DNA-binding MarR family transcriptional regulator
MISRALTDAPHNTVMDETVRLFHRMKAVAEALHGNGEVSAGRRGILRDLDRLGPKTVPQLARMRPVSRQHIQSLVDPMAEQGLVEFQHNPDHKRSKLIAITDKGRAFVNEMFEREAVLFETLGVQIDHADLETTARTLRAMREALASPEAQEAIAAISEGATKAEANK